MAAIECNHTTVGNLKPCRECLLERIATLEFEYRMIRATESAALQMVGRQTEWLEKAYNERDELHDYVNSLRRVEDESKTLRACANQYAGELDKKPRAAQRAGVIRSFLRRFDDALEQAAASEPVDYSSSAPSNPTT